MIDRATADQPLAGWLLFDAITTELLKGPGLAAHAAFMAGYLYRGLEDREEMMDPGGRAVCIERVLRWADRAVTVDAPN